MARPAQEGIAERLIDAALADMTARGVIGLRVAEVARQAGTSTTMIYRHFSSRDGLLEAALGTWFERRIDAGLANTRSILERPGVIHLDDILAVAPPPDFPGAEEQHRFVHRILVVASENEGLRRRVVAILHRWQEEMDVLVEEIIGRMPPEERFDGRIFTVFVAHHGWLTNDLLGDRKLTNEQYFDFLRNLLTHTPPPARPA